MRLCGVKDCIYASYVGRYCPHHDFALNAPQDLRDDLGGQEVLASYRREALAAEANDSKEPAT